MKNPAKFAGAILCNVDHGPGIKTLRYRHLMKQKNTHYVCFLEGKYRVDKFKKYGLDKIHTIFETGLPKLDVFFDGRFDREKLLSDYHLDPEKKTVLYAPSYKPTSIFSIGERVCELSQKYNLLIKLHPYSWGGKYAPHSQHTFFEKMKNRYSGMHLVGKDDHNILPYMFIADTMISDGSSVINEFLALNRCGIIVDLPEQTHKDGVSLLENNSKEWLRDSFIHIDPQSENIFEAVEKALCPDSRRLENIYRDKNYIFSYTDGKSAERVKRITEKLLLGEKE